MAGPRTFPGLLIPAGFQSMTLSNSTAVAVNSTVRSLLPSVLMVTVETQSARFRADGSLPTLTTGIVLLAANSPYWLPFDRSANYKFQRATGTCVVSIQGFKNKGD